MDFARNLLESQGWSEGQGLGNSTIGRAEAIKVKLKFDKSGIGGNGSEEFTFPWWDHAFNRAAANIVIADDSDDEDIKVSSAKDLGQVSSKEPKEREKKRFYGMFVKAAPLNSTNEVDEAKNYSKQLTDQELFDACGGLTGHKAARHGHHLSGKLKRIQDAEAGITTAITDSKEERKRLKKAKRKARKDDSDDNDDSVDKPEDPNATARRKAKKAKKAKRLAKEAAANGAVQGDDEQSLKRSKRSKSMDASEAVATVSKDSKPKKAKKAKKAKKSKRQ
eukprot:m.142466 g.142466  ORF g.142466 m.142466 type:complete len:278 (+) comp16157_c0_seq2:83-916(+)